MHWIFPTANSQRLQHLQSIQRSEINTDGMHIQRRIFGEKKVNAARVNTGQAVSEIELIKYIEKHFSKTFQKKWQEECKERNNEGSGASNPFGKKEQRRRP